MSSKLNVMKETKVMKAMKVMKALKAMKATKVMKAQFDSMTYEMIADFIHKI